MILQALRKRGLRRHLAPPVDHTIGAYSRFYQQPDPSLSSETTQGFMWADRMLTDAYMKGHFDGQEDAIQNFTGDTIRQIGHHLEDQ